MLSMFARNECPLVRISTRACYVCSLHSFRPALLISLLIPAATLFGQALFDKPVKVLGDPNFIGTAAYPTQYDSAGPNWVEGREVSGPLGIALDNSVSPPIVYIADTANNRVLAYQYATQLTAGSFADLILGQPDKYTTTAEGPGTALTTGLHSPTGMAVDGAGNLYVADSADNRIVRYPKPFAQPAGYQFPDLIIGQTSFAASTANNGGLKASTLSLAGGHTGLVFDSSGNLWVTDTNNNRVLRFPASVLTAGQNAPSADTVIGQKDFVSSTAATLATSLSGLSGPLSVTFDPAGDLLIADELDRVVAYPPNATTNTQATKLLGIAAPPSSTPSAIQTGLITAVVAAGANVIVADEGFNRVLSYSAVSTWPAGTGGTQISPAANIVIGQPDFVSFQANQNGPASSGTLASPFDLAASATELFVADTGNNRILVYPLNGAGPVTVASRVIGQLDFPYNAPNLVVGEEFFTSSASSAASGSAILDLSATPPHLYVADTYNNRVLGFNDFTHALTGQKADIVIGQPDLLHTTINYPTNVTTTPNNQGLHGPTGMVLDSAGNLYVADSFNSRILRFPAPFASGQTALETADLVIGQQNFTSIVTDPTAVTMSGPVGLAFTQAGADTTQANSGYLVATDVNQSRVLLFQKPFSSGMGASLVLGQPDFTSQTASSTTTGLNSPFGVAVDPEDRVVVADTGNSRIAVYETAANLTNGPAPSFFLNSGLSFPESIGMDSTGKFWVADPGAGGLVHFTSIDQLPLANYQSDASQRAVGPRSAFVDPYDNLLVADGVNRIVYFAPALGVVNAANYIPGRALAPGTLAAIFPSPSTNVLTAGMTQPATSFPLPTTLSGTQVIVNGNASALLYVSPGQINLPLSMGLPTSGTVDLQVVSATTGQVFGGAEIPLTSASPGLFAGIGGTGTGQVAALNQDNSINSATNPLTRGQVIQLFGTGQGPVPNPPPDGQSPTAIPTAVNPQILVGSGSSAAFVPDANIIYSGLAPAEAGVWQIDFTVPTTVPAGSSVPVVVLMNSIPSDNPSSPGEIVTTIALK